MSRTPIAQHEILKTLEKYHLLSAVDILEKLEEDKKSHNKTTIYRILEKLLHTGTICRHSLGSGTLYYELRDHHHDHIVCEGCGNVSLLDCQERIEQVILTKGFTPTHHHLTIFGLCQACSIKK